MNYVILFGLYYDLSNINWLLAFIVNRVECIVIDTNKKMLGILFQITKIKENNLIFSLSDDGNMKCKGAHLKPFEKQ